MIPTSATQHRSAFPVLEVAGLLMVLAAVILLLTRLSSFSLDRERMPYGLVLAGVPVSGLSRAEAKAYLEQAYGAPVTVFIQDQEIYLSPTR